MKIGAFTFGGGYAMIPLIGSRTSTITPLQATQTKSSPLLTTEFSGTTRIFVRKVLYRLPISALTATSAFSL